MNREIKKALISVSNKKGIAELAKFLTERGIEILSTGGTAKALRDAGILVKDVSEHTGSPEMLDGRVKTLHPKIHGGLLSRRDNEKDMEEIKKNGIEMIDMVVVNLYPFEETISKEGVAFADAIENIDIGGPAMLRSASKNFQDVAVIVDPEDYKRIMFEIATADDVSYATRLDLAKKVFKHTSRYDGLIADYLEKTIAGNTAAEEV
jgi:phosphoribosylaminoimidazolecarboxamide formyltransferase / IMP cyclohydrolase